MEIKYRKGIEHSNADALSRDTCGRCTQCMGIHEDPKTEKMKTRLLAMTVAKYGLEWQNDNEEIEALKRIIKKNEKSKFKFEEDIIMTKENKIWIPKEKREKFIKNMHRMLCHAGCRKVIEYIKVNYDMEDLNKITTEIIQSCDLCQKRKTQTCKTKEVIIKQEVVQPFEVISIDFCGPLQTNIYGKKYILGIIDMCSRYVSLTAVSKQDEKTTADTIMKFWILKYGAPRVIKVDCGKTFESGVMKELAKSHNVKLQFSSPYHHCANGLIERQFRTIRDLMSTSLKDKLKKNWVDILPEIEFTLNATVQSTTGKSPAEVIFGFRISREWRSNINISQDRNNLIEKVQEQQRNVNFNNDNRIHREFDINELVLVKLDIRRKEDDRYKGPFRISKKLHEKSYELIDKDGKIIIRNVEWLKPFKQGGCKD